MKGKTTKLSLFILFLFLSVALLFFLIITDNRSQRRKELDYGFYL